MQQEPVEKSAEYLKMKYEHTKAWRARHQKEFKANQAVFVAMRAGRLVKGPCAKCGASERIEAHHQDYDRPLEVVWLCKKHHEEAHHAA